MRYLLVNLNISVLVLSRDTIVPNFDQYDQIRFIINRY